MSKKCGIALLGVGTVGGGVYDLLKKNLEKIQKQVDAEIKIVSACARNLDKAKQRIENSCTVYDNWQDAINHEGVDVVIELIGDVEQAYTCAKESLAAKKPFITANKALLATKGIDLIKLSQETNTGIYFEAAVAGCIPVIRTVKESLAADNIKSIIGILNGTCNYIMTVMEDDLKSFDEALDSAMKLGYAEADPSLDIEGFDTAHKAVILSWLAFSTPLSMDNITVAGVNNFQLADRNCAANYGYSIKLLAIIREHANKGIEVQVTPALIANKHPLAKIKQNINAVLVDTEFAGELLFSGAGAGAMPTASAVVADLIEAIKFKDTNFELKLNKFDGANILDNKLIQTQAYMRVKVLDQKGVLANLSSIISDAGFSIEAIHQGESQAGDPVDISILLHELAWQDLITVSKNLIKQDFVVSQPVIMPIIIPHIS